VFLEDGPRQRKQLLLALRELVQLKIGVQSTSVIYDFQHLDLVEDVLDLLRIINFALWVEVEPEGAGQQQRILRKAHQAFADRVSREALEVDFADDDSSIYYVRQPKQHRQQRAFATSCFSIA
jgi:hypothetical protein